MNSINLLEIEGPSAIKTKSKGKQQMSKILVIYITSSMLDRSMSDSTSMLFSFPVHDLIAARCVFFS